MKNKELDALRNVDSAQLKERFAELARLKSLLFKSEMKNRRVSKIKSKLYHKIKKRDKDREEKKLRDYMEQIDPEAAKAYAEKQELQRVEERLRVRHGVQSKFAKNLKRFQSMDSKETRDAYHQVAQERNALVRKTKQTTRNERNSSSEGMSSDGSDSEADEDEAKAKQKTIDRIRAEVGSDGGEEEGSGSDGSDSDSSAKDPHGAVRTMNFDDAARQGRAKKTQDESGRGIMGLKFMQRAEEREKEALKLRADLAIKQIQGQDDYQSSDSEAKPAAFVNSSSRFGVKALPEKKAQQSQF